MYDDIKCPICNRENLTLIEKYEEDDNIKYVYLCRDCNKPFTVVIGVSTSSDC